MRACVLGNGDCIRPVSCQLASQRAFTGCFRGLVTRELHTTAKSEFLSFILIEELFKGSLLGVFEGEGQGAAGGFWLAGDAVWWSFLAEDLHRKCVRECECVCVCVCVYSLLFALGFC